MVDLAGTLAASRGDDEVDPIAVNGSAGNDMYAKRWTACQEQQFVSANLVRGIPWGINLFL